MYSRSHICSCNKPTLYYDELCPQSRSCYMLVKIMDIDINLVPLAGPGCSGSKENSNSSGPLPKLSDGQYTLGNGNTIMIYLCDKYTQSFQPNLCPRDYLARLDVLHMLFNESCVLNQYYCQLLSKIIQKKYPNVNMSCHRCKVTDTYNALNEKLKYNSCLSGSCFTIADLAIITTISSLDIFFPITKEEWPNLYRWFQHLKAMDCYKYNAQALRKLLNYLHSECQFPSASSRMSVTRGENLNKKDRSQNCTCVQMSEGYPKCPELHLKPKDSVKSNYVTPLRYDNPEKSQYYREDDMQCHCCPAQLDEGELRRFTSCLCFDGCNSDGSYPNGIIQTDERVDADGNCKCSEVKVARECENCKCLKTEEEDNCMCRCNDNYGKKDNELSNLCWCCEACSRGVCSSDQEAAPEKELICCCSEERQPEELICCCSEEQEQTSTAFQGAINADAYVDPYIDPFLCLCSGTKCHCEEEISEKKTKKAKTANISCKCSRKEDLTLKKGEDEEKNAGMPISRLSGRNMTRKTDENSAKKNSTISRISEKDMSQTKDDNEANRNSPTSRISGREMSRNSKKSQIPRYSRKENEEPAKTVKPDNQKDAKQKEKRISKSTGITQCRCLSNEKTAVQPRQSQKLSKGSTEVQPPESQRLSKGILYEKKAAIDESYKCDENGDEFECDIECQCEEEPINATCKCDEQPDDFVCDIDCECQGVPIDQSSKSDEHQEDVYDNDCKCQEDPAYDSCKCDKHIDKSTKSDQYDPIDQSSKNDEHKDDFASDDIDCKCKEDPAYDSCTCGKYQSGQDVLIPQSSKNDEHQDDFVCDIDCECQGVPIDQSSKSDEYQDHVCDNDCKCQDPSYDSCNCGKRQRNLENDIDKSNKSDQNDSIDHSSTNDVLTDLENNIDKTWKSDQDDSIPQSSKSDKHQHDFVFDDIDCKCQDDPASCKCGKRQEDLEDDIDTSNKSDQNDPIDQSSKSYKHQDDFVCDYIDCKCKEDPAYDCCKCGEHQRDQNYPIDQSFKSNDHQDDCTCCIDCKCEEDPGIDQSFKIDDHQDDCTCCTCQEEEPAYDNCKCVHEDGLVCEICCESQEDPKYCKCIFRKSAGENERKTIENERKSIETERKSIETERKSIEKERINAKEIQRESKEMGIKENSKTFNVKKLSKHNKTKENAAAVTVKKSSKPQVQKPIEKDQNSKMIGIKENTETVNVKRSSKQQVEKPIETERKSEMMGIEENAETVSVKKSCKCNKIKPSEKERESEMMGIKENTETTKAKKSCKCNKTKPIEENQQFKMMEVKKNSETVNVKRSSRQQMTQGNKAKPIEGDNKFKVIEIKETKNVKKAFKDKTIKNSCCLCPDPIDHTKLQDFVNYTPLYPLQEYPCQCCQAQFESAAACSRSCPAFAPQMLPRYRKHSPIFVTPRSKPNCLVCKQKLDSRYNDADICRMCEEKLNQGKTSCCNRQSSGCCTGAESTPYMCYYNTYGSLDIWSSDDEESCETNKRLSAGNSPGSSPTETDPLLSNSESQKLLEQEISDLPLGVVDSTSNASQENVTNVKHLQEAQPFYSGSKRHILKPSKIPRLNPKYLCEQGNQHKIAPSSLNTIKYPSRIPVRDCKARSRAGHTNEDEVPDLFLELFELNLCCPNCDKHISLTTKSAEPLARSASAMDMRSRQVSNNSEQINQPGKSAIQNDSLRKSSAQSFSQENRIFNPCPPPCLTDAQLKSQKSDNKEHQPRKNSLQNDSPWKSSLQSFSQENLIFNPCSFLTDEQSKSRKSDNKDHKIRCITNVKCIDSQGQIIKEMSQVTTTTYKGKSSVKKFDDSTDLECKTVLEDNGIGIDTVVRTIVEDNGFRTDKSSSMRGAAKKLDDSSDMESEAVLEDNGFRAVTGASTRGEVNAFRTDTEASTRGEDNGFRTDTESSARGTAKKLDDSLDLESKAVLEDNGFRAVTGASTRGEVNAFRTDTEGSTRGEDNGFRTDTESSARGAAKKLDDSSDLESKAVLEDNAFRAVTGASTRGEVNAFRTDTEASTRGEDNGFRTDTESSARGAAKKLDDSLDLESKGVLEDNGFRAFSGASTIGEVNALRTDTEASIRGEDNVFRTDTESSARGAAKKLDDSSDLESKAVLEDNAFRPVTGASTRGEVNAFRTDTEASTRGEDNGFRTDTESSARGAAKKLDDSSDLESKVVLEDNAFRAVTGASTRGESNAFRTDTEASIRGEDNGFRTDTESSTRGAAKKLDDSSDLESKAVLEDNGFRAFSGASTIGEVNALRTDTEASTRAEDNGFRTDTERRTTGTAKKFDGSWDLESKAALEDNGLRAFSGASTRGEDNTFRTVTEASTRGTESRTRGTAKKFDGSWDLESKAALEDNGFRAVTGASTRGENNAFRSDTESSTRGKRGFCYCSARKGDKSIDLQVKRMSEDNDLKIDSVIRNRNRRERCICSEIRNYAGLDKVESLEKFKTTEDFKTFPKQTLRYSIDNLQTERYSHREERNINCLRNYQNQTTEDSFEETWKNKRYHEEKTKNSFPLPSRQTSSHQWEAERFSGQIVDIGDEAICTAYPQRDGTENFYDNSHQQRSNTEQRYDGRPDKSKLILERLASYRHCNRNATKGNSHTMFEMYTSNMERQSCQDAANKHNSLFLVEAPILEKHKFKGIDHYDAIKYVPYNPTTSITQRSLGPSRIRGGLTNQYCTETKSVDDLRVVGCKCNKNMNNNKPTTTSRPEQGRLPKLFNKKHTNDEMMQHACCDKKEKKSFAKHSGCHQCKKSAAKKCCGGCKEISMPERECECGAKVGVNLSNCSNGKKVSYVEENNCCSNPKQMSHANESNSCSNTVQMSHVNESSCSNTKNTSQSDSKPNIVNIIIKPCDNNSVQGHKSCSKEKVEVKDIRTSGIACCCPQPFPELKERESEECTCAREGPLEEAGNQHLMPQSCTSQTSVYKCLCGRQIPNPFVPQCCPGVTIEKCCSMFVWPEPAADQTSNEQRKEYGQRPSQTKFIGSGTMAQTSMEKRKEFGQKPSITTRPIKNKTGEQRVEKEQKQLNKKELKKTNSNEAARVNDTKCNCRASSLSTSKDQGMVMIPCDCDDDLLMSSSRETKMKENRGMKNKECLNGNKKNSEFKKMSAFNKNMRSTKYNTSPTRAGEKGEGRKICPQKKDLSPQDLSNMSDEDFIKEFNLDLNSLTGSSEVLVVTKRTHTLKTDGAEQIEEKRLVLSKLSNTDIKAFLDDDIPEPGTEVIKKCRRIGNKVCRITINKQQFEKCPPCPCPHSSEKN